MSADRRSAPDASASQPNHTGRPLRVIEFAGEGLGLAVPYAGWLLAKLGAEVTCLVASSAEPVAGDSSLALARSAFRQAKQISPLDSGTGKLDALLSSADALLFDDRAALERHLMPISDLAARFPALIVGAATSFGLEQSHAAFAPLELDAQAVSATAWSLGDAHREPLTLPAGVAEHQSGAMLASACLLALQRREQTGHTSVIDISLAEVLASHVAGNCRVYIHHGLKWHRNGRRPYGSCGAYPFAILPCQDGDICISGRTRAEWERLVQVMGNPAWASEPRYQDLRAMGTRYPEEGDALLAPWLTRHTRDELEALALEHNLILSPLRRIDEVLATPQFHHRGFIGSTSMDGRSCAWPGLPFRISDQRAQSAPNLSGTLLSRCLPVSNGPGHDGRIATSKAEDLPLAGLRVLDFGWVWSAPWVGTMLGEMGAQVIKVEHGARPDNVRLSGRIIRDGRVVEGPTREMSPMFHQINHGKLGITLNLKHPRAVELAKALAAQSDLVIENMSPGSMERSGLGFESLRAVNARLVMLSMSAAGQFGPAANLRAYAPTMSAFAGLESLVGYSNEPAIGALNFALGDPNASLHGLLAALAALTRARATGEGAYIDLSQVESLVSVMRPHVLAAQRLGSQPQPAGNAHPDMAPHGIYPANGTDRWLSLAVTGDEAWRSLADLAAGEDFAADPRFQDMPSRLYHRAAIDEALARWTCQHERDTLVARLRARGIAASPVQSVDEMWSDPALMAREASAVIDIPHFGSERVFRAPWRLSGVKPRIDRRGPQLGEHNADVFGGILGLSENDIAELTAAGVIA